MCTVLFNNSDITSLTSRLSLSVYTVVPTTTTPAHTVPHSAHTTTTLTSTEARTSRASLVADFLAHYIHSSGHRVPLLRCPGAHRHGYPGKWATNSFTPGNPSTAQHAYETHFPESAKSDTRDKDFHHTRTTARTPTQQDGTSPSRRSNEAAQPGNHGAPE